MLDFCIKDLCMSAYQIPTNVVLTLLQHYTIIFV